MGGKHAGVAVVAGGRLQARKEAGQGARERVKLTLMAGDCGPSRGFLAAW
ncbi:hypothetical protein [Pleomorphomonas sp. PLEO]